ncbi:hypothetical protein [Rufibacter soli]
MSPLELELYLIQKAAELRVLQRHHQTPGKRPDGLVKNILNTTASIDSALRWVAKDVDTGSLQELLRKMRHAEEQFFKIHTAFSPSILFQKRKTAMEEARHQVDMKLALLSKTV